MRSWLRFEKDSAGDLSGKGNHALLQGALPMPGSTGRAMGFSGQSGGDVARRAAPVCQRTGPYRRNVAPERLPGLWSRVYTGWQTE